ncbi:hypothetical protein SCLCIDRAFT_124774 [Scleroderma citrinum Foug A]|uniref:CxC1-like cysteine cluster associated with KDZ transposases domain-containing protein n=1 Tax=Scleroderma citrinum Foug A TaxID=1036808 RepID=A0A0C3A634_9AGAM|nr:hypothetical protein SCLCIDRAFT_124774 [Scleroderma citrinum Foug A]
MQSIGLLVCSCATAAQQLLQLGYFPCAPLAPTLAVSLKVLTFVKKLFVHIPPNTSAWCEAFQSYLGSMGYTIDAKDGIRRRFSNAYHWYCILDITVDQYIQQSTQVCSSLHSVTSYTNTSLPALPVLSSTTSPPVLIQTHTSSSLNFPIHTKRCPSEYLHYRCPLCFGGSYQTDINQNRWDSWSVY